MQEEVDAPLEVEVQEPDQFDKAIPTEKASVEGETSFAPLAQYFGYDAPSQEQESQLTYIWEYFSKDNEKRGEIINAVREVERTLSSPEVGQSRLSKLFMYVRVLGDIADAEMERKAYLNDSQSRVDRKQ